MYIYKDIHTYVALQDPGAAVQEPAEQGCFFERSLRALGSGQRKPKTKKDQKNPTERSNSPHKETLIGFRAYSRSLKVGNPIASILKSNV